MKRILLATALAAASASQAGTQTISIYEDQDSSSLGAGFSAPYGGVFVDGTQGYGALPASGGKSFGTNLLRMGNGTLNYTLTGLQAHTSVNVDWLLAAIDSLDGDDNYYGPDQITVSIDGSQIFTGNYRNCYNSGAGQSAPTSNRISGPTSLFNTADTNPCFYDSAYDMSLLPDFQNIAHTGSSLLLSFVVSGLQGTGDESYGIDALSVTLNGTADEVPEPAMLGLFGLGAIGLGMARRRRT